MLPSRKNDDPDAPTRLAKARITGDGFKTLVYHISQPDLFITINYQIQPEPYDWVAITEPNEGEILIALYDGQKIIGVVEVMEFYKLQESEQWRPQIRSRFTNWLIIVGLSFWADLIFGMIQ